MNFLLDTNVISEWSKPHPDPGVTAWLADADEDRVFFSVITLAELRHGIERLPRSRRRDRLEQWLSDDLMARFDRRVLPVDAAVAWVCGRVLAQREARGRPVGAMDALIAATATVHDMALVTRNTPDFESTVPVLINPWIG